MTRPRQLNLYHLAQRLGVTEWPGVRKRQQQKKEYRNRQKAREQKPMCFQGRQNPFTGKDSQDAWRVRKLHDERVTDYYQSLGEKISHAIRSEFGAFCYEFYGPEDGMSVDLLNPHIDFHEWNRS